MDEWSTNTQLSIQQTETTYWAVQRYLGLLSKYIGSNDELLLSNSSVLPNISA